MARKRSRRPPTASGSAKRHEQRAPARSIAPTPRLAAELKRVARSAQNLIEEVARTNIDSVKFPKQRLIDIAKSMIDLATGSEEGALPALEYAEPALNDLRYSFIEIAEDDQLPDVARDGRVDLALSRLISDIATAKRYYSEPKLAAAAKSESPEEAVGSPNGQQRDIAERLRAVSQNGRAVAGDLDKASAELAGKSDAEQIGVDNLARRSRDVANLTQQEAIEIAGEKPHIAWLEKLHRGVVSGLRAARLCAGLARIAVEKIAKVYKNHVVDWLDAVDEGAREAESYIAKLRRDWQQEHPDAAPRPDRGRRDLSIFHDAFLDGSGRGPDLVVIPAGEFLMGSAESEARLSEDDRASENEIVKGPGKRPIRIARRFALGRFPVTFDDYDAFLATKAAARVRNDEASDEGWGRGRRPAINVSWDDAREYCDWLNRETGLAGEFGYRLPSEAEWEYACRAGTQTRRWWGDAWEADRANGARSFERGRTSPVDRYTANPWGLHDMIGNVWEWCADEYAASLSRLPSDGLPYGAEGKSSESLRVLRGGSWDSSPQDLRSACRDRYPAGIRNIDVGFRVARTL